MTTVFMIIGLQTSLFSEQLFEIDQFIAYETCADCHQEIAEQWENSMHHLAHKDPVYLKLAKFLRKGLIDAGEIKEAESCVKCHTPVGFVSGFPKKLSDDLEKTPETATAGVQCDLCHSTVDVKKMYNNGLVLEPGQGEDDPGIKYGPFDDSEPDFHEAEFSKLHTDSKICGTCHDVKHVAFGTPLETTYTEWLNSPYNSSDPEKHVPCQGCHMYQRPGVPATGSTDRPENPGSATDYSDERPHIFTHYFIGANAGIPDHFGDKEKADMARERLEHAATIAIDEGMIKKGTLKVTVTNTGAGHCLPTGLGDLRQVWLEITVKDKNNTPLYRSGHLDNQGLLAKDAIVFKTVFGDGKGNEVINIAKARQVLADNRIKPRQGVSHVFDLKHISLQKGFSIQARLLYRGAPQRVLNLVPDGNFPSLPVVEMTKAQVKI